jgi:hypothetical protein
LIHSSSIHSSSLIKGYFNKRDVKKVLQAAVGDRVKTIFGDGIVIGYRVIDDVYIIKLGSGKGNPRFWSTFYTQDKFERLPEQGNGVRCTIS